jgi:hypothetical protein
VLPNNLFNRSRINIMVVCALTANLRHAEAPGNTLLEPGEAGLPKRSAQIEQRAFGADRLHLNARQGARYWFIGRRWRTAMGRLCSNERVQEHRRTGQTPKWSETWINDASDRWKSQ